MYLIRTAKLTLLAAIVFFCVAARTATDQIGVDLGWVSGVRLQRGWLVTQPGRIVSPIERDGQKATYSWMPPLKNGDLIIEIGGNEAAQLNPLTIMGLLEQSLWRQIAVKVERNGQVLTILVHRPDMDNKAGDKPLNRLKLGDAAPDFVLPDLRGTPQRSIDLLGRWVLLNFWGTWCTGCYAEFAALNELKQLGGDQVVVVGVAMNDKPETIEKFFLKHHLRYQVLIGGKLDDPIARSYNVNACPTNVVIAPDGTVRFAGIGSQSLEGATRIIVNALRHQAQASE